MHSHSYWPQHAYVLACIAVSGTAASTQLGYYNIHDVLACMAVSGAAASASAGVMRRTCHRLALGMGRG